MLTISKPLSSGQAQTYHAKEFTSAEQNYWKQGDSILGEWQGRIAEQYGLAGGIDAEHFARLSDGQNPSTGEQLVRHRNGQEYTTAEGVTVNPVEHRAGWDATFSAPKSVPLTALVGGDDRVRYAHREAVTTALTELERYTVLSADPKANQLTVEREDGQHVTYDPKRLHGIAAYREIARDFAEGDRLQFTVSKPEMEIRNRDLGTVECIDGTNMTVRMDGEKARTLTFDTSEMRHFDHGYAVTSHSSQGLTTDRVLVNMDTYARHYYDLFQLASRPEILEMLQSAEYGEIKQDYDLISRTHFPGSYFYPDQMSFANSDALFATGDLSAAIGREYKGQCEVLCFGLHPSWEIVQARFMELRNLL